ncbi:unnamed protein product [Amoebophrya sp. A120]|nr:unnamed protein product [Amoebophrya sp. A120]|eukprot:GSA120T00021953001.1
MPFEKRPGDTSDPVSPKPKRSYDDPEDRRRGTLKQVHLNHSKIRTKLQFACRSELACRNWYEDLQQRVDLHKTSNERAQGGSRALARKSPPADASPAAGLAGERKRHKRPWGVKFPAILLPLRDFRTGTFPGSLLKPTCGRQLRSGAWRDEGIMIGKSISKKKFLGFPFWIWRTKSMGANEKTLLKTKEPTDLPTEREVTVRSSQILSCTCSPACG